MVMESVMALVVLLLVATSWAATLDDAQRALFYPRSLVQAIPFGELLSDTFSASLLANTTLREAASARGIFMGSAASYGVLHDHTDTVYPSVLAREYDIETAENGCKFTATEPQRNSFNFTQCTGILNFTQTTKAAFRGHNFIWGSYNPDWLTNGHFDEQTLISIMENHISSVGAHYAPYSVAWDVVNEAISDNSNETLKAAVPWYPAIPDYIDRAFNLARKALGSKVKLFYNDYGGEGLNEKSDKIYNLVKTMKTAGIPIDGIGLQMHVSVDYYPPFAQVEQNIARLGELGLEVHVTEMDVACKPPCGADRLRIQASIYGGMLGACLKNNNCKSFETWGFTDKYTWLWDFNNPTHENMQPLPFDTDYSPKPAYSELLATLLQHAA